MAERRAAYAGTWELFERETAGQYASRAESEAAYAHIASGSPWPQGYVPKPELIKVGKEFNMAMGPIQDVRRPGAFATTADIPSVEFVREDLAVKYAFKKDVGYVQRYRVIKPVMGQSGPIGPQLDKDLGRVLKGGADQTEFLFGDVKDSNGNVVDWVNRMEYLETVGPKIPIK